MDEEVQNLRGTQHWYTACTARLSVPAPFRRGDSLTFINSCCRFAHAGAQRHITGTASHQPLKLETLKFDAD